MYARWVLSRCTRLLHARTHQCQPPLARLATRQHQQHHQYFPLLTVLVQYVQQGCPCNSARNGPSQVTITRQMANFPATLYVLASSFSSFVASRPRSNAIRGTFSKTFHEGGYRSILFYSILIHNWGETTPTFLRICILDPSRNFFPFSAAWNEGGGVSILFAVKQYYVVKFMTASLALTMRPLGLCHG